MIKIQDTLWAVKHKDRAPLAYMCQVTTKADGTPDNATAKMQDTGRSWARSGPVGQQKKGTEAFYDNVPTAGMVLGDSVSRWTTQNKLFRVLDPRGFEVEVPTGNISTLLKYCTVVKGAIQEECVWGREDGSHILLPVNSEPYAEAKSVIEQVATSLVKTSDLKLGDRVKLMSYGKVGKTVYEFMGLVKISWLRTCSNNQYRHSGWASSGYQNLVQSVPLLPEVVQDDKWVAIFKWQSQQYDYTLPRDSKEFRASGYMQTHLDIELNPKIIERVAGEPSETLTVELLQAGYQYSPDRVKKMFQTALTPQSVYEEWRVVGKDSIHAIEFKPQKK